MAWYLVKHRQLYLYLTLSVVILVLFSTQNKASYRRLTP